MAGQERRKFLRSLTSPGGSSNSIGSPTTSGTSGGDGGQELRRTSSALARFTRSVSKLGSRRRRGGSDLPAALVNEQDELGSEKPDYETPIRRAETVPTRVAFHDRNVGGTATSVDAAAFLRAVPDMMAIDAALSTVGAAMRSAENLARTLRAAAADVDTGTTRTTRTTAPSTSGVAAAARNAESAAHEDAFKVIEANRQWERLLDAFEAALSEHRFDDAFSSWQKLHMFTSTDPITGERAWILENKRSECAALLISSLQHQVSKSKTGGGDGDGTKVVVLLCHIAGVPVAVATLLDAARARLRDHLESLPLGYQRAAATGSGAAAEEASVDLAAALGQALAIGIGEATTSVKSISSSANESSNDAIVYGLLCEWAVAEVAFACEVLRKSVVVPRAAPAGLTTTTRCAAAFIVHCDALDTIIDIPVGKLAREGVWPAIEPVLQRRARQLCEGLKKASAVETKAAATSASKLPSIRGNKSVSWEELVVVFPSAKRLTTEISSISAAVAPIAGPTAVASVRNIVNAAFMEFADSVSVALAAPGISGQKSSSLVAETVMEIATRLVEHVLADSTSVVSHAGWGPAVDAAAMVAALEGMAKTLGMTVDD